MKYLLLFSLLTSCGPTFYVGDKLLICINEGNPYESTKCDTLTVFRG